MNFRMFSWIKTTPLDNCRYNEYIIFRDDEGSKRGETGNDWRRP